MLIYIAGPMRGYPRYNFDAFFAAEEAVTAAGHEPSNPARHDIDNGFDPDGPLDDFDMEAALHWDLSEVLRADAILMLSGWENSEGATLEHRVAVATGKRVYLRRPPVRVSALEEAVQLITGDRNADYGHPLDDFTCTAALWTAWLAHKYDLPGLTLEPVDVGWMMSLLKHSREANKPKRDNAVDACGYIGTVGMCEDEAARRSAPH